MKTKTPVKKLAALAVALLIFTAARSADVQQLTRETQRMSNVDHQLTMAWWIPVEFWEEALKSNPSITDPMRQKIVEVLDTYQIFVVARARMGIGGATDAQTKDEILKHAKFVAGGETIDPIEPDQLTPQAQTMLATLKPALSNMLGSLGQSMQLLIYPSKHDGKRFIDPLQAGAFDYTLYDQTFHWRTPLASLLPKKVDPKTGDEFPGDYLYNPYTGSKLNAK